MGGGGGWISLKRKVIFFNILRTEQHITTAFCSFPIYETRSSPECLARAINNGGKMTRPRRWTKTNYVRRPGARLSQRWVFPGGCRLRWGARCYVTWGSAAADRWLPSRPLHTQPVFIGLRSSTEKKILSFSNVLTITSLYFYCLFTNHKTHTGGRA